MFQHCGWVSSTLFRSALDSPRIIEKILALIPNSNAPTAHIILRSKKAYYIRGKHLLRHGHVCESRMLCSDEGVFQE